METESVRYLSYADGFVIHFELMLLLGESTYGVFDRSLVEWFRQHTIKRI